MRRTLLQVAALAAALVLAGCQGPASNDRAHATATGGRRILSLAPSTTEIAFSLGAGDEVIGVTNFCQFPPEAASKPKFGGFHNPNVEAMLAARPTMALHATGKRTLEEQLRAAGIEVVSLPSDRLDDIARGLRTAGKALGRDAIGEREAAAFEEAIAALRTECASRSRVRVLVVLSRTPGPVRQVFSVGPNTFIDDLLAVVNAENALADSPAPYPQPSLEELIVRPPDVILEEGPRTTPDDIAQARAEWDEALGPQASRVRVVVFHDPHLSVPGPGILDSARRLAALVHDDPLLAGTGS